ncbi:unnamed protein product [Symbiodinium natans]|uniref:Fe2OG dioxygenase domain-containing protein n=1 Tax=Symbiodinium natans TaxID=878477 RepID=A0A812V4V8_9DINO|nr:unnamed protein product [Symbiodinium natans]
MLRLLAVSACLAKVAIATCPDDPEVDLCESTGEETGSGFRSSPWMALVLPLASARPKVATGLALALALAVGAEAVTCGELKDFYKSEQCCGSPTTELSNPVPGTPACPYNFNKPACNTAEPQTPRDLSTGATGSMVPKAATLTDAQANFLPLVNVHFHLGAEHKSDAYNNDTDAMAYDAASSGRRLASNPRPGFMCPTDTLTDAQMTPYTFQHCTGDVQVGKSYEVHYVHSSAGTDNDASDGMNADLLADGLGGAANGRGLLNPMVVVQGQIYQIVNGGPTVNDLLHGWTVVGHNNSVMYSGSTTGQSHDNSVCSPYVITWHVDKDCHQVSPESFDNLCKQMKDLYGMSVDLAPHGSRILVSPTYVVQSQYVVELMVRRKWAHEGATWRRSANRGKKGGYMHRHMDSKKCFGPVIACCSLLSDATLTFYDTGGSAYGLAKTRRTVTVDIPRRSLYFMTGASRSQWQHGIKKEHCPKERLSLTFRSILRTAPRAASSKGPKKRPSAQLRAP